MQTLKHKKQTYCSTVCHAWCCRNLIMNYDSNEPEVDKFFLLRGIEYRKEQKQIIVPCKCKWIQNTNKCRLYSWRPYSCKAYECDTLKSMTL